MRGQPRRRRRRAFAPARGVCQSRPATASIAGEIGCSPATLRSWVRQAERDAGPRAGLTSDERARMKALERKNRELRQANEILRKASAYFAQAELDRPLKR